MFHHRVLDLAVSSPDLLFLLTCNLPSQAIDVVAATYANLSVMRDYDSLGRNVMHGSSGQITGSRHPRTTFRELKTNLKIRNLRF